MSVIFSALQLVIRRSLANWRLLSSIVIGVLVAVTLVSSTPFYSNALNDLGLIHALRQKPIELVDVQVYTPNYPIDSENYAKMWQFIDQQISQNIKPVIRQKERWIKSQTFYIAWPDRPIPSGDERVTGHFNVFSNLEKHITLVEGRYPDPIPSGLAPEELTDPGLEIEAMVGSETAENFFLNTGDRLIFLYGYGENQEQITVRLTGIIDPVDPKEEYWFLNTEIFTVASDQGLVIPLFIPEQTLFEGIGNIFTYSNATYNWFYYVDLNKISSQNAEAIKNNVRRMEHKILTELPRSSQFTVMDDIITSYQQKLLFTQIPLFLLVFQIVGIILYYLITVANMVIERQSGEIALLRSRGASTGQVFGIFFLEGLLISVLGGALGPFLGAFIFSFLGRTAAFYPLTGGGFLPIRFSNSVFILAGAGVLLCLLALMVPTIQAARRGVVHQRQHAARPPRAPFWQRFYLDIVLLVFGAALYWELRQRGSLLTLDILGGMDMDPLLLITPMLVIIAAAILFLRLFPLIINLLARLAQYITSAATVLGLRYMARNPIHYGRLILLLMMAASVGMFSASFLGTLERSYDERAMYSVGSDIRLEGLDEWRSAKGALVERYSSISGVEDVSVAYRGGGTVGTLFSQVYFNMLAIDPENFEQVSWYRKDFSEKTLHEIVSVLAEDKPVKEGMDLPVGTEKIGLWVRPLEPGRELIIIAKVRDGLGHYLDYELGSTESEDWQYMEANLLEIETYIQPTPPFSLQSIYIRLGGSAIEQPPRGVYFDDLQVTGTFSSRTEVIEDFEDISEWTVFSQDPAGRTSTTDSLNTSDKDSYNGTKSGVFSWVPGRTFGHKGIYPNLDTRPLLVVASRSFLGSASTNVGSRVEIRVPGQYISAVVRDVVDYFPTLDPTERGFLIANIDRLSSVRNLIVGGSSYYYPNEVWLAVTDDDQQRSQVFDTLNSGSYRANKLHDQKAIIEGQRKDPLIAAGWGGVLLIAFLGVILVSGLGFVVYAYLSAQRRQLEFAILRTLGFSLRQIIGLICFEQIFIIVLGMGIGTLVGMRLSTLMMPFLQLTERGELVLPPFVLTTDWLTIGIAYIILTIAFAITIFLVVLFFSRVALHRTLRLGEQM
jgi:ABC-type lipoprotein release transport system permease subunit